MKHLSIRWICCLLFPLALLADDHESRLDSVMRGYVGRWAGEFRIESMEMDYKERFQVEQQYWMRGGVLHGVAVMQRRRGIESARSRCEIREDALFSEIEGPGGKQCFIGRLVDGAILWSPADGRDKDYEVMEKIEERGGRRFLTLSGIDTFEYKGKEAVVVYEGRLKHLGGAAVEPLF